MAAACFREVVRLFGILNTSIRCELVLSSLQTPERIAGRELLRGPAWLGNILAPLTAAAGDPSDAEDGYQSTVPAIPFLPF